MFVGGGDGDGGLGEYLSVWDGVQLEYGGVGL